MNLVLHGYKDIVAQVRKGSAILINDNGYDDVAKNSRVKVMLY